MTACGQGALEGSCVAGGIADQSSHRDRSGFGKAGGGCARATGRVVEGANPSAFFSRTLPYNSGHARNSTRGVEMRSAPQTGLPKAADLADAPPEALFFLGEAQSRFAAGKARKAYQAYLEKAPAGAYARRAKRALD